MIYEIKRDNIVIFQHEIRGKRTQSAPAVDFVDIEFDYFESILLEKNDTIEFKGQTYYCDKQYANFQKSSSNLYKIRGRFVSENYRATEIAVLDPNGVAEFEIEGNLLTLLTLAVDNLNRISSGWSYVNPPTTVTKVFQISEENVMSFLTKLSGEFEIPFEITNKEISFKNPSHPAVGAFAYGKGNGFLDLRKSYINNTKVPNTVYATGGDGLVLDNPVINQNDINANGVIEGFYSNDDIKPTTRAQVVGTVTANNIATTNQINYDLDNYIIPGTTPLINFETGALGGLSFYITQFDFDVPTNVSLIYFKPRTVDGTLLPDNTVRPQPGDFFNITNITQPQEVVDEAKTKLELYANDYLLNGINRNLVLEANLDPLYDEDLKLNDRINIVDVDLDINGDFVINEIREDLQNLNKKELVIDFVGRSVFFIGRIGDLRLPIKNDNIIDIAIENNYDDLVRIEEEVESIRIETDGIKLDLDNIKTITIPQINNKINVIETDLSDVVLDLENIETVELPLKENLSNKKTTLEFEEVDDAWYPNISAVKIGLSETLTQANNYTNNAVNNAVGGSGVVNSVTGANVDNSDPKNPIVAEFRPIAGYNSDMLNKANVNGSNATGNLLDAINLRHSHANKSILDAITAAYTTAEQNKLAGIEAGAEVNVNADWNATNGDAEILNKPSTFPPSAHTHSISQIVGLQAELNTKLESNDLDGFVYDVQYNSSTHEITFYLQNEPNIVIDLPIEQLIKGVQLVGDDLIFTFEDGSTVTVPMNTLLVGVVKSVNGLTPNSQGEIVLQITDIPGLQSSLDGKVNLSGNNATGDLLEAINWRHEHANKSVLDNLTQSVINNSHTHTNKSLLDTYNQTNANITDAVNKRHDAVTLGANASGLSLVGQVLSLGLAGASSTGALSSVHWNTFNNKFDSPSGTTAQYIRGNGTLATFPTLQNLTQGNHIDITSSVISVKPTLNTWIEDSGDNNRILMSTVSSGTNHNDMVLKQISSDGFLKLRNAQDEDFFVYRNSTQEVMMPLVGVSTGTSSNIVTMGSNGAIWKSNRTIGDFALASQIPTNYITTNTTQSGLSGNKETDGFWHFKGVLGNPIALEKNTATNLAIRYINVDGDNIFAGLANGNTYAIGGSVSLDTMANRWMWVDSSGLVSSQSGFSKTGATNNDILLGSGGHRPVSDFALASSIITPNDGLLTISTSADLTGGGTFSADQATASNVNIGLSSSTLASLALADTAVQPSALSGYLPLAGGTMTGAIDFNIQLALNYLGQNRILFGTNTTTISGNSSTGSHNGIFFRPINGSAINEVTIDGGGQINTANHGNSSQWRYEDYGLGKYVLLGNVGANGLDTTTINTGFYLATGVDTNIVGSETVKLIQLGNSTHSTGMAQILIGHTTNRMAFRDNQSSTWNEIIHTSNLDTQATSLGFIKSSSLSGYVPTSRTLTINGTTFDLSQDRTWNIPVPSQVNLIQGAGISVTGTYPNLTITNTAPNVVQTLSLGATAGNIELSGGGGNVSLQTLFTVINRQDSNVRELANEFRVYRTNAGMLNYPTASVSTGFRIERFSSASSQIGMDFNTRGGDDEIWYKTFNQTSNEYGWYQIASREWITAQGYSTTDTITRLRGTASGTYTSGDLTLLEGTGIGITQSGSNFTITNTSPNVQADWNATSGLAQILNKPTIPNAPNNGSFQVQGTGSLTGSGSTSANASANTTADLDLSQNTKNEIQQGVDSFTLIQNTFGFGEYQIFFDVTGGGQTIDPGESFKTIVCPVGGGGGNVVNILDHTLNGAELYLQTSGTQQIYTLPYIDRDGQSLGQITVPENSTRVFFYDLNENKWRFMY